MAERLTGINQENVISEKVIDDLKPVSGVTEFLNEHPTITRVVAGVGAFLTVGSVAVPVYGAENQSAIIEQQPGGEAPSKAAFDKLTSPEKQSAVTKGIISQTNNPYYVEMDSNGNYSIKKSLLVPTLTNGEMFGATTPLAESLGYTTKQNDATKTTIYKNNEKQITYKNGSKLVQSIDLKTKKITNIPTKNSYIYAKDKSLCKGSEGLFMNAIGKNNLYAGNLSAGSVDYLKKLPAGSKADVNNMMTALKCLEPNNTYGNDVVKLKAALDKYNLVPIKLDATKTACVPANIYNSTINNLKKDANRFKLLDATGLTEKEIVKNLGLDKYKNDASIVMIRVDAKNVRANDVVYKNETKKITLTEAINLSSNYMSGGEFLDKNNFPYKVEVGSTNVVRVYSSAEKTAEETALLDKVEKQCKSGDVMYYRKGSVCVLNSACVGKYDEINNLTASVFDSTLKKTICKYDLQSRYFPSIVFNKDMGLCLTDGYRITASADSTGQFVELKKYVPTGTPEEIANRVEKQIDNETLLKGKYERKVWVNNSKNEKAICLLVGGEIGLNEKHLEAWTKGIQRCNEIDPELIDKCVKQYGLNIVCTADAIGDRGQNASFLRLAGGGALFYGGKSKINLTADDMAAGVPEITIVESRGLSDEDHHFEKNGTFTLKIDDKAVETNSSIIEKEAYSATQLEIYAGVPEDKRLKFDEHRKIARSELDAVLASIGFNTETRVYGRLKIEELSQIGASLGSYNNYLEVVNNVK